MSGKDIRVERDSQTPSIATVVLDNPGSHNAISLGMYRRIPEVFAELDADPAVKVIVVRGAGTKSFASGADITEFEEVRGNSASAKAYNEQVAAAEHAVEGCTKPTIAMVHGYCIGGGCGLALACDLRFADERSRFGITPPSSVWCTAWNPPNGLSMSSGRRARSGSCSPASTSTPRTRCGSA